jgi:tripartite-type tricarboxylate transporter receptor subunit TctC
MVIYPHVKSNRLRGIALTGAKRSSAMPEIPAFNETVPGYETLAWQALLGPKALPKELITRWNTEMNRVLQLPEIRARMAADGVEAAGGGPELFFDLLRRDLAKWQKVVRIANIKAGT